MPLYSYRCTDENCLNVQDEDAKISEFKDLRPKCLVCGAECEYVFVPTVVQAILKDGPTGSWPSKGNRFKNYRAKQSEKMKKRQQDRYGHLNRDCVPNYQGQLTEDWREAQDLAMRDKDRNLDSLQTAQTFTPHIEKERKKKGSPISR
jgi:hypothetical protein